MTRTFIVKASLFLSALLFIAVVIAGCPRLEAMATPPEIDAGVKLLRQGNAEGAKTQFDLALKKNSTDVALYAEIIKDCSDANQPELATDYLNRGLAATQKSPNSVKALIYSAAGIAALNQGNVAASIDWNRKAYELDRDNPNLMNNLGYAYAEQPGAGSPETVQELEFALKLTQNAVVKAKQNGATESEVGTYLDSVGWVQYRLKLYNDAIVSLNRAIELESDRAELHYHLAMAYIAKKRYSEARIELRRALLINPLDVPSQQALLSLPVNPPKSTAPPTVPAPPTTMSPAPPTSIQAEPNKTPNMPVGRP